MLNRPASNQIRLTCFVVEKRSGSRGEGEVKQTGSDEVRVGVYEYRPNGVYVGLMGPDPNVR